MKIALIGGSGYVGRAVVAEATHRGHDVTVLVRSPERVARGPHVTASRVDVFDAPSLVRAIRGHDVLVSAYAPGSTSTDVEGDFERAADAIVGAAMATGLRLVVVGGAATLAVAPGTILLDTPGFNEAWKPTARGTRRFLEKLRALPDDVALEWTFLSPSAILAPGERTGVFRVGRDELLRDASGESRISTQDYAVALVDEIETPKHRRMRFTVGY